jgi:hypothetical protein
MMLGLIIDIGSICDVGAGSELSLDQNIGSAAIRPIRD